MCFQPQVVLGSKIHGGLDVRQLLCSDGGKLRWRIVRKPKPRRLGLAKVRHSAMKRLDSVRLAKENEAVAREVSEDSVDLAGGRRRGDGEKVARGWRL